MFLRIFIMSFLGSSLISFTAVLNAKVMCIGHELGVKLANVIGIDPYMAISTAGAGIAYDVMIILLFLMIIIEVILSKRVIVIYKKLNNFLWKILEY